MEKAGLFLDKETELTYSCVHNFCGNSRPRLMVLGIWSVKPIPLEWIPEEGGDVTIIVRGGLMGCEITEILADIIPDESADTKKHFEHVVPTYGIRVFTETLIKHITKATFIIETKGESRKGP